MVSYWGENIIHDMKPSTLLLLLLLSGAALAFVFSTDVGRGSGTAPFHLQDLFSNSRMHLGVGAFELEKVDTDAARQKGLSGRDSLPSNAAMLFIFDTDDHWGIWMKDMKFPIDIIWLDKDYTVVDIKENASPESYPDVFRPRVPARYVLEVNAGVVSNNAILIGAKGSF